MKGWTWATALLLAAAGCNDAAVEDVPSDGIVVVPPNVEVTGNGEVAAASVSGEPTVVDLTVPDTAWLFDPTDGDHDLTAIGFICPNGMTWTMADWIDAAEADLGEDLLPEGGLTPFSVAGVTDTSDGGALLRARLLAMAAVNIVAEDPCSACDVPECRLVNEPGPAGDYVCKTRCEWLGCGKKKAAPAQPPPADADDHGGQSPPGDPSPRPSGGTDDGKGGSGGGSGNGSGSGAGGTPGDGGGDGPPPPTDPP
jgi:hypothetical protein